MSSHTITCTSPVNYIELTFTADARKVYRLWIRGKADSNSYANDSAFVQGWGTDVLGPTIYFATADEEPHRHPPLAERRNAGRGPTAGRHTGLYVARFAPGEVHVTCSSAR